MRASLVLNLPSHWKSAKLRASRPPPLSSTLFPLTFSILPSPSRRPSSSPTSSLRSKQPAPARSSASARPPARQPRRLRCSSQGVSLSCQLFLPPYRPASDDARLPTRSPTSPSASSCTKRYAAMQRSATPCVLPSPCSPPSPPSRSVADLPVPSDPSAVRSAAAMKAATTTATMSRMPASGSASARRRRRPTAAGASARSSSRSDRRRRSSPPLSSSPRSTRGGSRCLLHGLCCAFAE